MSQILFKQSISGVVLLNKPLGLSSNHALQRVKHLLGADKAGHTGSLDPLASGMLPICLGDATRFSQYLLDADKCYTVTACLGVKTTTGDQEGDVLATKPVPALTTAAILALLEQFTGDISQTPSMYSALKHQGKPLYKFARQGIEIERAPRPITIHRLELLAVDLPKISMRVVCSKGTYIRNLVEDMGDALGVGAHVVSLHRDWVEGFKAYTMQDLDVLMAAKESPAQLHGYVHPLEVLLQGIHPELTLNHAELIAMYQGKKLPAPALPAQTPIRLYDTQQQCVGLGHIIDGRLQVLRLVPGHPSLM